MPSSFIEHLHLQCDKTQLSDIDTKDDTGNRLRVFEDMKLHLSYDDPRLGTLLKSYRDLYNYPSKYNKKMFLLDILMHHAIPDLMDRNTGQLKDEIITILAIKNYETNKKELTECIVKAYMFYFISEIYLKLHDPRLLAHDLLADQNELINFDNLTAIITFIKYLEEDTRKNSSHFTVAHKLLMELRESFPDTPDPIRDFSLFSDFRKKPDMYYVLLNNLFNIDPDLKNKISDCSDFYKILNKKS